MFAAANSSVIQRVQEDFEPKQFPIRRFSMRTKRVVVLAFLTAVALSVTVSFSFGQATSEGSNIQVEIQRLTQDWYTAFSKGDGAAMDQMEVPNLVLINPSGTGDIWHKDAPRAGKEKPKAAVYTVGQSEVRQFGNTAVLTGSFTSTSKNSDRSDELNETVVWIRMNNKWLVASAQWTDAR
jgi:ketosteroid isomerase-like protein